MGNRIFYIPKRISNHESTTKEAVSHTFLEDLSQKTEKSAS